MNIFKCRNVISTVVGQWRRQVGETGSIRKLCIKPQETKTVPPPTAPADTTNVRFKLPGYKPSDLDRKILMWSGRFKTADQIPEFVSFEMIDAARNKVRVKACYGMILVSIAACLLMVILGKQAAGRQESLTAQNMEKKAKWRQEVQEQREVAAMAEKAP